MMGRGSRRINVPWGSVCLLALAFTSLVQFTAVEAGNTFVLSNCPSSGSIFDPASLSCTTCGSTAFRVPNNRSFDWLGNAQECICGSGAIVQPSVCSPSTLAGCATDTCSLCPAGSAAARTSPSTCLPCGSSTSGVDASTGDCSCGAQGVAGTHVLVERDAAGALMATMECLACPTGKRVFLTALPLKGITTGDPYQCQGCPNSEGDPNVYVTASGDCGCNAGYRASGVLGSFPWAGITCLPDSTAGSILSTYPEASAVQVSYNSLELNNARNKKAAVSGKTSVTFQHLYASAAVNCVTRKPGSLQGNMACQALANLCVLQMYNPSSTVCALYQSIYNARKAAYNGFNGWPSNGLPFLFYSAAEVRAIVTTPETDNALKTSVMAFNTNKEATSAGSPTSDVLQFYLAKHSVNGTFLGVERLASQLDPYYLCAASSASKPAAGSIAAGSTGSIGAASGSRSTSPWLNFGVNHAQAVTCDLSLLAASSLAQEPVFYDLYVRDSGADAALINAAAAAKKNGWATSGGSGASSSSSSSSSAPRALGTLKINEAGSGLPLTLYPVPVAITNYQAADGSFPNANPTSTASEADDVYTRRFILAEAVSAVTQVGSPAEILRYAANIRLSIRARVEADAGGSSSSSKPNRLATPLLTITYKERLMSDVNTAGAAADLSVASGPVTSKGLSTAAVAGGASLSYSSPSALVSAANSLSSSLPMSYDVVTFAAEQYSTSNAEYGRTVLGLAIVLGMLVIGWAFVRVIGWTRMNARNQFEAALGCLHVAKLFLYLVMSFAPAFFWFLWIVGGLYWLIFFKLQTAVSVILPPARPGYSDDPYQPFTAALCTIFACYIVRVLSLLWYQVSIDVFFVDWEKPRGALVRMGADHEAALGKGVQPGMPSAVVAADSRFAPISIWRTLHAANEWAELQTSRRLHLPLVLLVLATIMQAGNLQYVAVARPGVGDLSPGPINPLLQFGNNVFWFLVVAGIQLLFTVLIYERYVGENPSSSFIDVCTVAKVSVLLMDQRYHGYYLHCNAPHEHSDGSMAELGEHLFEEAAAMRVGRGLPGCPDASCQSFELHVPALWREMYDRVYRRLLEAEAQEALAASAGNSAAGAAQLQIQAMQMQAAQQQQQRSGVVPSSSAGGAATSLTALSKVARVRDKTRRLGAAFAALTAFLKGFIEESDPDYRRQWRERTLIQQMFDLPPDMLGESLVMGGMAGGGAGGGILPGGGGLGGGGLMGGMGMGGAGSGGGMLSIPGGGGGSRSTIMMLDRGYRFERVMWRGIELDLLVWDMLVYCFTDYWQQSPTVAAVVTLVANMALQYLRSQLGQRNIAKKTLVDERFLD